MEDSKTKSSASTRDLIHYCFFGIFIAYSIGVIVYMIIFTKRMSVPFITKPWTKAFMVLGYAIIILIAISLVLALISIFWLKNNKIYRITTFVVLCILLGCTLGCGIPMRESSVSEVARKITLYVQKHPEFVKDYPEVCLSAKSVDDCEEYIDLRSNKGGYQLITVVPIWIVMDLILIIYTFCIANDKNGDYDSAKDQKQSI